MPARADIVRIKYDIWCSVYNANLGRRHGQIREQGKERRGAFPGQRGVRPGQALRGGPERIHAMCFLPTGVFDVGRAYSAQTYGQHPVWGCQRLPFSMWSSVEPMDDLSRRQGFVLSIIYGIVCILILYSTTPQWEHWHLHMTMEMVRVPDASMR